MTIRFSCQCDAAFEIPDDNAGRLGKCRKCGREMVIPSESEPARPTPVEAGLGERAEHAVGLPAHDQGHVPGGMAVPETRFCPFCGRETNGDPMACLHCTRAMRRPDSAQPSPFTLTPADWILVTALAPLGLLGGFVSLIRGNRKGLGMIGISTASLVVMWLTLLIVGSMR